jgi:PadR family transcriptional regulator, regulatory protein PadR
MCDQNGHPSEVCHCRDNAIRGYALPRILLHLAQKPSYGYELMEVLNCGEPMIGPDPGGLYRLLRSMEEDGLVESSWDTRGSGAARRVYQITEQGIDHLQAWTVSMRNTRQWLDHFLAECETYFSQEREQKDVPSL